MAEALSRIRAGEPEAADLRLLTKHFLAVLEERAPGHSVEVRVPPYAAVQVIPGVRHTRGTPPAVIETDADTWIALSTGDLTWEDAEESGSGAGQRRTCRPLGVSPAQLGWSRYAASSLGGYSTTEIESLRDAPPKEIHERRPPRPRPGSAAGAPQ